jgi:hypothetical protein
MARININEFSAQAGGLASRANQVRTDPAVVKAAQDAWVDLKDARNSCVVLAREANAAWQRTRTSEANPTAHQAYPAPNHIQDRPTVVAS